MKKVIIIGAGIAGLSAGVYARQCGFDATIYEAHTIPGGASTSWKRKGYLFEGGMHWLTGSSPTTALHKVWKEVGAIDENTNIYLKDPFITIEREGTQFFIYRNVDKLQAHMLSIAPEDEKQIRTLCSDIKKLSKMDMPITDLKGVKCKYKSKSSGSIFAMIPGMMRMGYYGKLTAKEYAMTFKSPLLQQVFMSMVGEDMSATGLVFTLSTLCGGDGGYPQGGSLAMAGRMAKKFEALGGKIEYGCPVDLVQVENGKAMGIVVGEKLISADAVIVTQDTLMAIDKLFNPPIHEPWAERMRQTTSPILNTFICLGIHADLSDIPESIGFPISTPITYGDITMNDIAINNYATYEGYAPQGCSAVTSVLTGDTYDWWKKQKEQGTYEAEKQKLAEAFIAALCEKYPQIQGKIDLWDVATPLTYERYLHSYKGSWMSNMPVGGKMLSSYPCKPESISSLYFAGQRLQIPGGVPVAVETGRSAVQHLCRDTSTVFQGEC